MTVQDLVILGAQGVKATPDALDAYKALFMEAFGKTPDCPACGTSLGLSDWRAFEALSSGMDVDVIKATILGFTKQQIERTFKTKPSHKIIRYAVERDGRWFIERSYPEHMTEEFAIGYLESAQNEVEFAEFSKIFITLPQAFRNLDETQEIINTDEVVEEILNDATKVDETVIKVDEIVDEIIETVVDEIVDEEVAEVIETDEAKELTEDEKHQLKLAKRREADRARRDAKKA